MPGLSGALYSRAAQAADDFGQCGDERDHPGLADLLSLAIDVRPRELADLDFPGPCDVSESGEVLKMGRQMADDSVEIGGFKKPYRGANAGLDRQTAETYG